MKKNNFLEHPSEAALERFVLHQSSEAETETVEAHFLACDHCVTRLQETELQVAAIRRALREVHQEKVAKTFAKDRAKRRGWFFIPGLSIAGALAAIAITFSVLPFMHDTKKSGAMNIELTAYRSFESPVLAKGHDLHVTLNATGLNGSFAYVTLVDSIGNEVWKATARNQGHVLQVNVPKIEASGAYFFRLYDLDAPDEPIREFAVDVE